MTQRGASKTAIGVAMLRAVHQLIDDEPKILDDPITVHLLGPEFLKRLEANSEEANEPAMAGLRGHVVLRSRYSEDRLAEAARRGVRQLVTLGAGFDTFAYRQPNWARSLRILEVDHPGTQREKKDRLRAAGVEIPENVEFVPADFEQVSMREALQSSSLDFGQPAFFSCLGVLVYLSEAAAHSVFALVASFPQLSEIVFTFSLADSALGAGDAELRARIATRVASLGEPWRTHFDPELLEQDLQRLGFSEFTVLTSEQAEKNYFAGRHDRLRPPRRSAIASAVVGGKPFQR